VIGWTTASGAVRTIAAGWLMRPSGDLEPPPLSGTTFLPGVDEVAGPSRGATHEFPSVSPDEALVAFFSRHGVEQALTLDVARVDDPDSAVTVAATAGEAQLSWLPDSTGVVYADGQSVQLVRWSGAPRRTAPVTLWRDTGRGAQPGRSTIGALAISPEGRRVAFLHDATSDASWSTTDIMVVDVAAPHRATDLYRSGDLASLAWLRSGLLAGAQGRILRIRDLLLRTHLDARHPPLGKPLAAETLVIIPPARPGYQPGFPQIAGVSRDERFLLAVMPCSHGCTDTRILDLATHAQHSLGDVTGLGLSPTGGAVVYATGCDSGVSGGHLELVVAANPLAAAPSRAQPASPHLLERYSSCLADWR
jgi:hypothetical protein